VISGVGATVTSSTGAVVSWTTNEVSTSVVDYGTTTAYGLTNSNAALVTSHQISLTGLTCATTYHYRVRSTDGSSNQATSSDNTFTTSSCGVDAPTNFNVWYGDSQTFGQRGKPQQWVNVLGNVSDPDGLSSLSYSLDGGGFVPLTIGPNGSRLVNPGDFNAEIDYASLPQGANSVVLRAVDAQAHVSTHTVTVTNAYTGQSWPTTYSVNWATAGSIQNVVQIVDGKWAIQGSTVRTLEPGYDRLLALGDMNSWKNYDVTAEVTLNSVSPSGMGTGIVVGWKGHSSNMYGSIDNTNPLIGHPFPGLGWYSHEPGRDGERNRLNIYSNWAPNYEVNLATDTSGRTLQVGVTYVFRFDVQSISGTQSRYSLKVWPRGTAEPAAWDLQVNGPLSQGAVVLGSHMNDVSFGAVSVAPLP